MFKKIFGVVLCFLVSISSLLASEDINIYSPTKNNDNLIFANYKRDAIIIYNTSKLTNITISGLGIGYNYSLSKRSNLVGYKKVSENGLQTPFIFDINQNKEFKLAEPSNKYGQVMLNESGAFVFTDGNILNYVQDGIIKKYDLGYYSNLTPLSNNNLFVAFNDGEDQLFLLNLQTNERIKITDSRFGYFNPKFNFNSNLLLYQSLSGIIFVYDINKKTTSEIGMGLSPKWAEYNNLITFYKNQVEKDSLINSDIYIYNYSVNTTSKITSTDNRFEIEPQFVENDSKVIYSAINKSVIYELDLSSKSCLEIKIPTALNSRTIEYYSESKSVNSLSIPYVHQVYDTPSWHYGHGSCAPSAAAMVLAYYNILPPWLVVCPSPYQHYNYYGRYVCEKYRYRQIEYSYMDPDGDDNPSWGGYGFMWSTGSPYSRMADYYRYHGLAATQSESPAITEALTEINELRPYTMCVLLTSAGHLIIAHGVGAETHTLIFHDPYGNKNTPGYPSYDGQYARYDWPGYNNGFENLNTVAWCIKTSKNYDTTPEDTLVDDRQYTTGFYMHNRTPATMMNWYDRRAGGYKSHFWYTPTNATMDTDLVYATWKPKLSETGLYDVQVYIPDSYNTCKNAIYKIHTLDGIKIVHLNQSIYTSQWVSLGKYNFAKGDTSYVYLGNASDSAGTSLIYDAIKWVKTDTTTSVNSEDINILDNFIVNQNYPNPFNPSTTISYTIPSNGHLQIQLYNELGQLINILKNGEVVKGHYNETITFNSLSSGHIFINFSFRDSNSGKMTSKTIKSLYIK